MNWKFQNDFFQNGIETLRQKFTTNTQVDNNANPTVSAQPVSVDETLSNNDAEGVEHDEKTIDGSTADEAMADDGSNEQKKKQANKKKRMKHFLGYIRSRKLRQKYRNRIKNKNINDGTVKCETQLEPKRHCNMLSDLPSQNEILETRTRVNGRASVNYAYPGVSKSRSTSPKKTRNSIPMPIIKLEKCSPPKPQSVPESNSPRNKRRINYSEDLVDEAFMYEQMLHDQRPEKPKPETNKPKQRANAEQPSVSNIDSRLKLLEQRNEISIMPVKSRLLSKNVNKIVPHKPLQIKSEPLFNITSSVSVHIKPRTEPSTSNIQISNITSLYSGRNLPPKKMRKMSCKYCTQTFPNENQLAVHQLKHLCISSRRLDMVQILNPKLRRVSVNFRISCESSEIMLWRFRVECWLSTKSNSYGVSIAGNCMKTTNASWSTGTAANAYSIANCAENHFMIISMICSHILNTSMASNTKR